MFNVIRIPTKFSRTIKRFSREEKSELLDMLITIGDGGIVNIPDSIVGDTLSLIYGEWMNMESKNGKKPEKSLIQYSSEGLGEMSDVNSEARVEYNRVEENKIEIISKEITETSSELVIDNRRTDINQMQELIKQKVLSLGLIYKQGKQERNRIQNILTAKDFGEICDKSNMTREDFVLNIIELSTKLEFWKGKIYNGETLYKHYASVYNEAVRKKSEMKKENVVIDNKYF